MEEGVRRTPPVVLVDRRGPVTSSRSCPRGVGSGRRATTWTTVWSRRDLGRVPRREPGGWCGASRGETDTQTDPRCGVESCWDSSGPEAQTGVRGPEYGPRRTPPQPCLRIGVGGPPPKLPFLKRPSGDPGSGGVTEGILRDGPPSSCPGKDGWGRGGGRGETCVRSRTSNPLTLQSQPLVFRTSTETFDPHFTLIWDSPKRGS